MRESFSLTWLAIVGAFRSRASLEAEIIVLRHQLNVLRRNSRKRPTFGLLDRLIFASVYRLAPTMLDALAIVKPASTANSLPARIAILVWGQACSAAKGAGEIGLRRKTTT
jgi:hypothetical protein